MQGQFAGGVGDRVGGQPCLGADVIPAAFQQEANTCLTPAGRSEASRPSPKQEIEDLRAGRGMAMALAAELNGYTGPLHTLELARELELTSEQEQRTRQLFAEMQQEAGRLGEELVDAEEALDRLFREGEATPDSVLKASMKAAQLRGRLRATHLLYHLEMMDVLSPEQLERYKTLRGYR